MAFPNNVYVAAAVSSFLTSAVALPFWRLLCLRVGLVDDPGHRKIHDLPVPLAGGLAVMTGLAVPVVLAALFLSWTQAGASTSEWLEPTGAHLLSYGLNKRALQLAGILVGATGMLVLGILDDKHELKPAAKFSGQVLIAGLVAASGARITLFIPIPLVHYAVTILWILTVINALNFMDNMNGLCAGLGIIAAGYFGLIAAREGQYLVALIAFLAFGAQLGFLPFNFPRARAFLGDAGSHLIGYLLAVLAILPHFYTAKDPRRWAVFLPLLILAVPLGDMVWVVLLRWRKGQPFYIGDTNHLSHRLVRRGLSRTWAVVLIWLLAIALGAPALLR